MLTILVVEDERDLADLLREILEDEGYAVIVAGNGQEALTQLDLVQPQLIISDIMMPIMDGVALCRAVQKHPRHRHVPIVLTSAAKYPPRMERPCFHAFLPKPFELDHMLTTVTSLTMVRTR